MNNTATPGPWRVEQGTGRHVGHTVITARHAGMDASTPLAHLSNVLGAEECAGDARLIAALPDLLAAMEGLMHIVEAVRYSVGLGPNQMKRVEAARAAIAIAKGDA